MLTIKDEIACEPVKFRYVQTLADMQKAYLFVRKNRVLALDTESTGIDCYIPDWELRTFQFGNANTSYVIPARFKKVIAAILELDALWIGHNGPHDIRSLDKYLGYETGIICKGETYIPAHHADPRNRKESGIGHGLKEQAIAHVDPTAGKWEIALKQEFKKIQIPIPDTVYKSGARKGQPKYRKAKLSEGWALIDPENPAYIAYAASDPLLTFRLWQHYTRTVKQFRELYAFDLMVQNACDRLQRRGIRLDTDYTERYSAALESKIRKEIMAAKQLGCNDINSGPKIANALSALGGKLKSKTPKGKLKTDSNVLEYQAANGNPEVAQLSKHILTAKRLSKRRETYAEGLLRQMDANGRVHPSINSLAARTARMSAGIFQQLPTKDQE